MELWWAERLLKHYVVRAIKLVNGKLLIFITLLDKEKLIVRGVWEGMTFIKVQPMIFIRFQYLHIGTHTEFVESIPVTLLAQ